MFYLDKLHLEGFRNYPSLQVIFNPGINLFYGENAQGKTNLLEAIYMLSVNRSFRTHKDKELIMLDDDHFVAKGFFCNTDIKDKLTVSLHERDKLKIILNGTEIKRYSKLQDYPVVLFCPDDIRLINDGPVVRRKFMNLMISRLSGSYFALIKDYQQILKQRNNILRTNASISKKRFLLDPWNESLVKKGSIIIDMRCKFMRVLEEESNKLFHFFTSVSERLSLEYISDNLNSERYLIEQSFFKALERKLEVDVMRGYTTTGPHIDDFKISINDRDARKYASQGQKRTAALALKLGEIYLLKRNNDKDPILLLDDVFSEFDQARQLSLISYLEESNSQCFISTATQIFNEVLQLNKNHKSFTVKRGLVHESSR